MACRSLSLHLPQRSVHHRHFKGTLKIPPALPPQRSFRLTVEFGAGLGTVPSSNFLSCLLFAWSTHVSFHCVEIVSYIRITNSALPILHMPITTVYYTIIIRPLYIQHCVYNTEHMHITTNIIHNMYIIMYIHVHV